MATPGIDFSRILAGRTGVIDPVKNNFSVQYRPIAGGQMFRAGTLVHPRHAQEPGTVGYLDYNPAALASKFDCTI